MISEKHSTRRAIIIIISVAVLALTSTLIRSAIYRLMPPYYDAFGDDVKFALWFTMGTVTSAAIVMRLVRKGRDHPGAKKGTG